MTALATPRLRLRPVAPADVGTLHALLVLPDVRRFLLDDREVEPAWVEALVEASAASFAARGFGFWGVEERAGSALLLGLVGLRETEAGASAAVELLYAVHPKRQGEGIALEASRAVLAHGFLACRLPRIVAETDVPNVASRRVLEKLGMARLGERAGTPHPRVGFALRREGFAALPAPARAAPPAPDPR